MLGKISTINAQNVATLFKGFLKMKHQISELGRRRKILTCHGWSGTKSFIMSKENVSILQNELKGSKL